MLEDKSIDEQRIEIWEKVVDVQMHFNDLCLKVRNFAVSILGVMLGASAVAYRFGGHASIYGYSFHTSAIFILISMFIWLAFFMMDRYWYHELLKGSVHHGLEVENSIKEKFPEIALAHSIRAQSHNSLNMNAAKKLNVFYWSIFSVQLLGFILILTGSIEIQA